jgi:hypothetical protein
MMDATTISIIEGTPEAYPDAPDGLSTDAAALSADMIWQRLESYIAWRYSERSVQWIAEGCGEWRPTLKPATITTVEVWRGETWEITSLCASPLGGYMLPGVGPYRFTGTAGVDDADMPVIIMEAFRRLAEYFAEIEYDSVGKSSENVPDIWQGEYASPSWRARALQDSGAADLLRNYRRAWR